MLKKGTEIHLLAYKHYKGDSKKNVDVGVWENSFGKCLQFQILDTNAKQGNKGLNTGFLNVNVHTDIPLRVDDCVTIKEILYIQKVFNYTTIGITIEETFSGVIEDQNAYVEGIIGVVDF